MKRIFVPTQAPFDWQRLLADPVLHWKMGYSAMTTAACWEDACRMLPPEVKLALEAPGQESLVGLELLAAFPEWKMSLPGGGRQSQTDVIALARNEEGLVVIGVEAKVDEPFGPTLGDKRAEKSVGQAERLDYLHTTLKLDDPLGDEIRYQLLHRTVSALLTAVDFHATTAVMLVQSFSPTQRGRADFQAFCTAMRATPLSPDLHLVPRFKSPRLYLSWCAGDQRFLTADLPSVV